MYVQKRPTEISHTWAFKAAFESRDGWILFYIYSRVLHCCRDSFAAFGTATAKSSRGFLFTAESHDHLNLHLFYKIAPLLRSALQKVARPQKAVDALMKLFNISIWHFTPEKCMKVTLDLETI